MFDYSVPEKWYDSLYKDQTAPCSAARPFSLKHETKTDECWLVIHGYRGYPGEFVRPAVDLYEAGFDVYVPRMPGHGTSGKDFINTTGKDWIGLAQNALDDLKTQYAKVNIFAHSMGTAIAAVIAEGDKSVGKIVYACLSFENKQMGLFARIALKLLSVFTPKVKCKWHSNPKYHLHYENAPCDELYLGGEYWQYYFTKQLGEYYKIMKNGLKAIEKDTHEHLVIHPERDHIISEPSVVLYKKAVGNRANVLTVKNATHSVFYDKDPQAEETAVRAVIEFAKK